MTKSILLSLLVCSFKLANCQVSYTLSLVNSSNETVTIRAAKGSQITIDPHHSKVIADSIRFIKFAPVVFEIHLGNTNMEKGQQMAFIVKDRSAVKLEIFSPDSPGETLNYKFDGLPFMDEQKTLVEEFFPARNEFARWERVEYVKTNDKLLTKEKRDSIQDGIRLRRSEYLNFVVDLISATRLSEVAYYLMESELLPAKNMLAIGKEKIISLYQILSTSHHSTSIGKFTSDYIAKLKSTAVGSVVKNFRFRTKGLKEYDLYQYTDASKALLIFTARGCKACIAQAPIIKEIENKLKDNIKIVYVSLDRTLGDFEKTILSGNYPGIITSNIEPYNYAVNLQDLFLVGFIPQLFLIDKNRKIIYDNLSPYDDEDLTKLMELLELDGK